MVRHLPSLTVIPLVTWSVVKTRARGGGLNGLVSEQLPKR